MTTHVLNVQSLLDAIVKVGAKICVVADLNGLMIATASSLDDIEREEALSALSAIVIPVGETASQELYGDFKEIIIRTDQEVIVALSLESNPKTAVMAISDKSFERLLVETLQEKYDLLSKSMDGTQLDIQKVGIYVDRSDKISKFFDSLRTRIIASQNFKSILRILRDATDEYSSQTAGGWSTLTYQFNAFSRNIKNLRRSDPNFPLDELKEMTSKEITKWKSKALATFNRPNN